VPAFSADALAAILAPEEPVEEADVSPVAAASTSVSMEALSDPENEDADDLKGATALDQFFSARRGRAPGTAWDFAESLLLVHATATAKSPVSGPGLLASRHLFAALWLLGTGVAALHSAHEEDRRTTVPARAVRR
jgi:hypothetical protein